MKRALLLALVAACSSPREHTIIMHAMTFEPAVLEISAGDRVVWRNDDLVPHTATAAGRFDSGPVQPDTTFKVTLSKKGELRYACTLHPTMLGQIIVK